MLKSPPIIRWAGSKRKVLHILKENLPVQYNRYVEPFCGSASLFFEQDCQNALLADINHELINAFEQIKVNSNIRELILKEPNTPEKYYELRALNPQDLNDTERAVRFLYLNRFCFNGVYRTNKKGHFNVPRGNRTGSVPPQTAFDSVRKKLSQASLVVADYKSTLNQLTNGDFVYIDPPYTKSGKNTGEYGPNSFTSNELPEFLASLDNLNKRNIKFLLSYRACKETINHLSKNYNVQNISVKRHVAGFKNSWNDADEILVKNYE